MRHPRADDFQRAAARDDPCGRVHAEVQLRLARREPLRRSRFQRLQLRLVVRRSDMLDVAGPTP